MPFVQGESGNPAGRPKGAKTKINEEIRKRIVSFLDNNFEVIENDLMQLEPRDRIKFYVDLLSFGLPKLKAIEFEAEINDSRRPEQIITTLTRDELIKRINA